MPQQREQEADQRRKQEALQGAMAALREELSGSQAQLTELLQPAFNDPAALQSRRDELASAAREFEIDWMDCHGRLNAAIKDLYRAQPHPKKRCNTATTAHPFCSFPCGSKPFLCPFKIRRARPTPNYGCASIRTTSPFIPMKQF